MIRTLCLGLLAAVVMCGTASAEIVIDRFDNISGTNGPAVTLSNGVTRTVTNDFSLMSENSDNFSFIGDSSGQLIVAYDWSMIPNFANNAESNRIDFVPFSPGVGGVDIVSEVSLGGGAFGAIAPGPISISGLTSVAFRFTTTNGSPLSTSGSFGGNIDLSAVPEPTSVLLFGSLMTLGMIRRRSA